MTSSGSSRSARRPVASEQVGLASLAYTLQVGREAMEERLGFVADSVDRLLTQLQAFSNGIQEIDEVHRGQVKNNKDGIGLIAQDDDMKEADREVGSRAANSRSLRNSGSRASSSTGMHSMTETNRAGSALPAYPFAKDR